MIYKDPFFLGIAKQPLDSVACVLMMPSEKPLSSKSSKQT